MQLELNMERLRMAIDDLLMKLATMFSKPKLQIVFLINNYDMTSAVLKVNIGSRSFFFFVLLNLHLQCYREVELITAED